MTRSYHLINNNNDSAFALCFLSLKQEDIENGDPRYKIEIEPIQSKILFRSVTSPQVFGLVALCLIFAAAGIRTRFFVILCPRRFHYTTPSHPPTLSNFALFIILIDHQQSKEGWCKIMSRAVRTCALTNRSRILYHETTSTDHFWSGSFGIQILQA